MNKDRRVRNALSLHRETLLNLERDDLRQAAAADTNPIVCSRTVACTVCHAC